MRKNKTRICIPLIILFMMMGVGYALLSNKVKITGTAGIVGKWDIYISDIHEKNMNQATTVKTEVIGKTAANFDVQLQKPGSYAEYEVTVKNNGKLDAVLKAIQKIEGNQTASKDIVYSVKDLEVDTTLLASQEIKFIFRVEFLIGAVSIPTTSSNVTLILDYEQMTGINHPSDMVSEPTYTINKTGWQQNKIVTILYPPRREELTYEYSLDRGITWNVVVEPQTSIEVPFYQNGSVIARITDGTNELRSEEYSVTEIDRTAPIVEPEIDRKTTNAITVKANCTDLESGISEIEFSKNNGATYINNGTNQTYTFSDLTTGIYQFKTRCTNRSLMTTTSDTISESTLNIPLPTYHVDKTGWQSVKTVTITYPERTTEMIYEYSTDGGKTWSTVNSNDTLAGIVFMKNGSVIARIKDGTNTVTANAFTVSQIDTTPPVITPAKDLFTIVQGASHNVMGWWVSAEDTESGLKSFTANITDTTTLSVGMHSLTYKAVDYAGNTETTTVSLKVVRKTDSLIQNGYQEFGDNTNFPSLQYRKEGSIEMLRRASDNNAVLSSNQYIPVDTTKTYYQEVTMRTTQAKTTYYIGLMEYDIDKNLIHSSYVAYISNTLTTLKKDLNNGDTVVYLNSTQNFETNSTTQSYRLGLIFWNYKDSTGYQYPEETYSRNVWSNLYSYTSVNKANHTITLKEPWNHGTIKAGTKVSQSSDGQTYNYGIASGITLNANTWTTKSNTISGVAKWANRSNATFRYGTKYVKFIAYDNYNHIANTTTDYRNLIFKIK